MTEIAVVLPAYRYDNDGPVGLADTVAEARALARAYKAGAGTERSGDTIIQLWQHDAEQGWRMVAEERRE